MAQYLSGKQNKFLEVRYEAILLNPEIETKKICDFLNIDYKKQMILNQGYINSKFNTPIHKLVGKKLDISRIDSWQEELSKCDIAIFERHARDTMRMLSYTPISKNYYFSIWMKLKVLIYEHIMSEVISKVRRTLRYYKSKKIKKNKEM